MKKHKLLNRVGSTPPFVRYVSGIFLLLTLLLNGNYAVSQTVLINPAQGGGFELGSTFADNGWTTVNDATNTWNVGNAPAWQTGSNCAYVSNNGGAAWDYTNSANQRSFFYRDIAFPAGETNIVLSFDWRAYGEGNYDNLQVYVTDLTITPSNVGPTSTNTTTTGWSGYTNGTTGYYLTRVSGSSVPTSTSSATYTFSAAQATYVAGSTKRLIFVWKNDGGGGTNPPSSVDNISLTSSCVPVTAIAGSGATSTSFNANWNAFTGATGYNVQYRVVGSSTWVDAIGNPYTGTSAIISGLNSNTAYEYRVAATGAVCNAYSSVLSISTSCNPFSLPYNEGFNSASLNTCWSKQIVAVQTGTKLSNVASSSSLTTSPFEGSNFVFYNSYSSTNGAAGSEERLVSPTVISTGVSSVDVEFYWFEDNATSYSTGSYLNEGVTVQWSVDGLTWNTSTYFPRHSASAPVAGGWSKKTVTLPVGASNQASLIVGFKFRSEYGYNMSLDNVTIKATPTCIEPTAILISALTPSSATVSWSASVTTPGLGYEYEVRTSGAAGSGATGLILSGSTAAGVLTDNIAGLTSNTTYRVYLRSNCDGTDFSVWSTGVAFTTPCNPYTVPYFEGFETAYTHNTPVGICLSQASITGTAVWTANNTLTSSNRAPNTGAWNAFLASSNEDWLFIPIELTAGISYRLQFYARQATAVAANSNLSAAYGTANNAVAMTNVIGSTFDIVNGGYQTFVGDFIPTTTGVFYVGIKGYMNSSFNYISIDDISLTLTPLCSAPLGLNASPNSLTSGALIWNQSSSSPSEGYEYEVRESGAAGSGATGLIASGTTVALDTTALVTGLTANSTYSAYVRANCGVGVYSDWTLASTFTTSYCTPAPTSVDGQGITNVSVGTINNTTVAEVGNYGDYSTLSTDMELGNSQTVAITYSTGYTYETKIWIDFNDDLDFNDAGENVYTGVSLSTIPTTLNATFDIPVTASLGAHRMRIGGQDSGIPTSCYTGSYGSYEDYTVNLICPTTIPAAMATNVDVCTGSSAQLVATGIQNSILTWYDAATAGNILAVNDTLNTAPVTSTTSFWVEQTYAACPGVSSARTEVISTTFDVIVDLDVTDISCNGLTDGSVSVGTVTCGTAPFMYSINGMPYDVAPMDLAVGTYSVRVRDANMNESNFMTISIVEPSFVTPTPTTMDASACVDATSGAIVNASSYISGGTMTLSFDLNAQPTEVNAAPGIAISSTMLPQLPVGSVITSVTLNMNSITSNGNSWDSEVRLGVQGAIANNAAAGTGTANSPNTFNYTRVLPTSSVNINGGLVELMYWNSSDDVVGQDATFLLGSSVATITIEYTNPTPVDFSWWTAPTGGTQIGTGTSLETIGTSVVASPAVAGSYMVYAQTEYNGCSSATREAAMVQVNTPTSSTVSRVACASPYTFNGQDFTTAGTYTVTIPNAAGCDSVITLNLTFGTPSASSVSRFSCVNPYVFNGQSFTTAGTYTVVIPNISGCDSTITLDLTFGTPTTHTITTVSCASPYTLNGTDYTTAGTFTQLLVNAAGCDSTITLNLTFGTPSDSTVTAHTCASPFTFNGQDYTTAGTYTVVIPNASGCDSTITLNLTFGTPNTSTLTEEACGFYVYNGMTYTQSGTYTHVFTNASGCDSTVTLNLTINTVSTPVATVDGITLTASGATGSFVWINCANDESVGNGSTFTATENGSYSVIVTTSAGCTAVSECVIVNQVGIDKNEMLSGIAIYPNPTTSNVTISMADDKLVNAKLYDAQGKLINTIKNVKNGTVISLDTLENGVYMIHVSNETGNQVFRIVKQ